MGQESSEVPNGIEPRGQRILEERLKTLGFDDGGREFVAKVCHTMRRQGFTMDLDEMMGFGFTGFVEAAERFDPNQGVEFRSFAYYRVRGAILDGMRKMGPLSRRGYQLARAVQSVMSVEGDSPAEGEAKPLAPPPYLELREKMANVVSAMTLSLYAGEGVIDGAGQGEAPASAEEQLEEQQLRKLTRELLLELPEPEREVLRRHYVEDVAFEEIAAGFGLSRSWVCRIHLRGLKRLGLRVRASL